MKGIQQSFSCFWFFCKCDCYKNYKNRNLSFANWT